ncbi:MAG: T9SS type A sorting domain-containing protein [Bacteroidota bacterium]
MKKLLPFLFLTVSIITLGQNQIRFDNSNAMWTVAKTYPHANPQYPDFVETSTKLFGYKGDTLIGSDQWLKLYKSPDSDFISNLSYQGNIRETNGVVVYMDTTKSVHTLYNFNLQPGDSVMYRFESGNYYLKIETIDSILINGAYYKRFHFLEPWFPPSYLNEVWIEEIGSIHGPLFPANPRFFGTEIPDSTYLTCFKLNNSTLWNNPIYAQCFINIILGTENPARSEIKIFPNPASNHLFIEFPGNHRSGNDILIYDLQGRLIQCSYKNQLNSAEIDVSDLDKGVYIMQINGDGNLKKIKLVKQ